MQGERDSKKNLTDLQLRKRSRKGIIKRSGLAGMVRNDQGTQPLRENYRERLKRMIAKKHSQKGE